MMTLRRGLGLSSNIDETGEGGMRIQQGCWRLCLTGVHHRACWFKSKFAYVSANLTLCVSDDFEMELGFVFEYLS